MLPLSHTPVSLVEVWVEGPKLVQRTVAPVYTVVVMGVKVKSLICTPPKLGGHVGPGVGVNVRVAVGGVPVTVGVGVQPKVPRTRYTSSPVPERVSVHTP